jgi:hypothetical protein
MERKHRRSAGQAKEHYKPSMKLAESQLGGWLIVLVFVAVVTVCGALLAAVLLVVDSSAPVSTLQNTAQPDVFLSILPSTLNTVMDIVVRMSLDVSRSELASAGIWLSASAGIIALFSGILGAAVLVAIGFIYDKDDPFGSIHPDTLDGWVIRATFRAPMLLIRLKEPDSLAIKMSVGAAHSIVWLLAMSGVSVYWSLGSDSVACNHQAT